MVCFWKLQRLWQFSVGIFTDVNLFLFLFSFFFFFSCRQPAAPFASISILKDSSQIRTFFFFLRSVIIYAYVFIDVDSYQNNQQSVSQLALWFPGAMLGHQFGSLYFGQVKNSVTQIYRTFRHHRVPAGSPSRGEDVAVYVLDINQLSLPTPFHSVLVCISVFMTLSTVFQPINSPDKSPVSRSVLPVLFLPNWSFQLQYLFLKVSFSPNVILCGWLGLKHQLTKSLSPPLLQTGYRDKG